MFFFDILSKSFSTSSHEFEIEVEVVEEGKKKKKKYREFLDEAIKEGKFENIDDDLDDGKKGEWGQIAEIIDPDKDYDTKVYYTKNEVTNEEHFLVRSWTKMIDIDGIEHAIQLEMEFSQRTDPQGVGDDKWLLKPRLVFAKTYAIFESEQVEEPD